MKARFSPRALFPSKVDLWSYLEKQAWVAHHAALSLERFRGGEVAGEDIRAEIRAHAREADKSMYALRDLLARAVSTPIDREDLTRLSRDLEAVIHTANHAIRSCVLFGVTAPTRAMEELMKTLVESTRVVTAAIGNAKDAKWADVLVLVRTVQQLEKEGDTTYRGEMARLFQDQGIGPKVLLREKEVLSDLERAIDLCDAVAGTLTHVAAKHV